jgi:[NiFe] hydrogenase diaphorase moiety large subunit
MEKGAPWFANQGSAGSSGQKLLSVSGDCKLPGVYELPFGISVKELLKMVGAEDAIGVQVGGPSGQMIGPDDYSRSICYDDLATGGSVMIFGPGRNLLEVAHAFMEFFEEESCGYCTPCRVGNTLLRQRLEIVMAGKGQTEDIDYMEKLGESMKVMSRCGLGQTSANPVLSTIKNFRPLYNKLLVEAKDGLRPSFDIGAAVKQTEEIIGRKSIHHRD